MFTGLIEATGRLAERKTTGGGLRFRIQSPLAAELAAGDSLAVNGVCLTVILADSAEILLKPEELLPALAKLPASNWPYGRVVAAAENGVRASEKDGVAIRRNKGIVGGILQGAHITVEWIPSA